MMCVYRAGLSGKICSSLKLRLGETFSFVFRAVKVLNLKIEDLYNRFFSEHNTSFEGRVPRSSGELDKQSRKIIFK